MASGNEFRDRLIQTALEKGYLDANRVEAAFRILRSEQERGSPVRLHQVLLRYRLMTRDQLLDVRRTMAREGLLPRLGDFEILARLGRGVTGTVYRARQRSLDRVVALKILASHLAADRAFEERFFREARAAAKVSHPHVVQVYDVGQTRHTHYIVMEYVDGVTLETLLADGPLEEARAARIGAQAARALVMTESCGLVHRDIKPGNIMVNKQGVVKLADLGLAVAPDETSNTSAGTPAYMAPEQARGEGTLDVRADIYALGCTLFHAVTGRPPYAAATTVEMLRMHAECPTPDAAADNPTLSPAFCAVLKRMMAKRPEDRHSSARELAADFDALAEGGEPTPPATRPSARPITRWLLWAAILLPALAALALAVVLALQWTHSEPASAAPESAPEPAPATTAPPERPRARSWRDRLRPPPAERPETPRP